MIITDLLRSGRVRRSRDLRTVSVPAPAAPVGRRRAIRLAGCLRLLSILRTYFIIIFIGTLKVRSVNDLCKKNFKCGLHGLQQPRSFFLKGLAQSHSVM